MNDLYVQPKYEDYLSLKQDWHEAVEDKFEDFDLAVARWHTARAAYVFYYSTISSSLDLSIQQELDFGHVFQILGDEANVDYAVAYNKSWYDDEYDAYKDLLDSCIGVGYPSEAARDAKVEEIETAMGWFESAAEAYMGSIDDYEDLVGQKPFYSNNTTYWVPCLNQEGRFQDVIDFLNSKAATLESLMP